MCKDLKKKKRNHKITPPSFTSLADSGYA